MISFRHRQTRTLNRHGFFGLRELELRVKWDVEVQMRSAAGGHNEETDSKYAENGLYDYVSFFLYILSMSLMIKP